MELQCLYARDLFEPATIQRWFGHFRTMVEHLIAHPAEKLGEVGLLTPAEQRELRSFSHVETALLHNVLPDGMIASAGGQLESYVLDGKGQPTPIGVPGELHVGGDIAEAPPEELADQLPKHPYNPDPDARLYPTGAAARFLPNGDLEIITLREPAEVSTNPATTGARASAQLEYALIGMWEEYLGVSEVSVTDDFFELGGHSLLLARISARVQSMCGITLPLRAFFDAPTIAELALVIEAQMAEQIEQMPEEEIRAAVEVAAGV